MPPKRKQSTKIVENGKRTKSLAANDLRDSDGESGAVAENQNTRRRSGRLTNDNLTVKKELTKGTKNKVEAVVTRRASIESAGNEPGKKGSIRRKSGRISQVVEVNGNLSDTEQMGSDVDKDDGVNRRSRSCISPIVTQAVNKSSNGATEKIRSSRRKSTPLPPKDGATSGSVNKNITIQQKNEDAVIKENIAKQVKRKSGPNRRKNNDLKQKEELLTRMKANVGVGAKRKGSNSDSNYSDTSEESDDDFDDNYDSKRRKEKGRKKLPAKKSKTNLKKGTDKVNLSSRTNNIKATPKPELLVKMGTLSDSDSDGEFASVDAVDFKNSELRKVNCISSMNVMTVDAAVKSEAEDSSEESEWEEVDGSHDDLDPDREPVIPKDGVEITLEMPDILGKRRRREFDLEGHFRRKINRYKKRNQLNLHKVHLLCLLGHGIFVSELVNGEELQAVALSVIPADMFKMNRKKVNIAYLERALQWFRDTLSLVEKDAMSYRNLTDDLLAAFETKEARTARHYVILFVLILRVLRLDARFVMSLQPLPFKPVDLIKVKPKGKDGADDEPLASTEVASSSKGKVAHKNKKMTLKSKVMPPVKQSINKVESQSGKITQQSDAERPSTSKILDFKVESDKNPLKSTLEPKGQIPDDKEVRSKHGKAAPRKSRKKAAKKDDEKPVSKSLNVNSKATEDLVSVDEGSSHSRSLRRRTKQPIIDAENSDDEDDDEKSDEKKEDVTGRKIKGKKLAALKRSSKKAEDSPIWSPEDNSDSDFEVEVIRVRPSPSVLTSRLKKNRKIKSEDEDDDLQVLASTIGNDYWVEVYLESEKRWICIDCVEGKVNCFAEMESRATQPLTYVVTFDNSSCVKDVTRRYAENWMSQTRKLRVKAEWWEESLAPFRCRSSKREKDEDRALETQQLERPLPKTIGEFKSHPLYVLQRHLLKYEALYPPDVAPIGYIRKEAVYPRECVYTCYSREAWLRNAKTVKLGEKPYKIVKGRPRWNKVLKIIEKSHQVPPLEVFGDWQVEDYDPPAAVNGIVPRNEYGNVDLYKPCMLPKGCVHLQVPGLKIVAKKLGIDCAGAVIGWDKSTWIPGPLYDGYIVCEEYADALMEAWQEQQVINEKRQKEKRDKRVWGNWRRIIRGLLIRERLQVRYFSKEEEENSQESEDVPT